jgi:hypothetical protein
MLTRRGVARRGVEVACLVFLVCIVPVSIGAADRLEPLSRMCRDAGAGRCGKAGSRSLPVLLLLSPKNSPTALRGGGPSIGELKQGVKGRPKGAYDSKAADKHIQAAQDSSDGEGEGAGSSPALSSSGSSAPHEKIKRPSRVLHDRAVDSHSSQGETSAALQSGSSGALKRSVSV